MSGGPTLWDVARIAKVSKSTASRALNGDYGVSEATRSRVLDVCKSIGYSPNKSARSLKTGGRTQVGIVLEDIRGPWGVEIVYGIYQTALRAGYDPILLLADVGRLGEISSTVKNFGGVVYVGAYEVREVELPLSTWETACVCAYSIGKGVPSVVPDDRQGGWLATTKLLESGHRRIAVVMGPERLAPCRDRIQGYRDALRDSAQEIVAYGEWTLNDGYRHAQRILQDHPDVTAFFAGDEHIACGIIYALKDLGKDVPRDVSVIAMGNRDITNHIRPTISTLRIPLMKIGETATGLLLQMISDKDRSGVERTISIDYDFIARESIAHYQ